MTAPTTAADRPDRFVFPCLDDIAIIWGAFESITHAEFVDALVVVWGEPMREYARAKWGAFCSGRIPWVALRTNADEQQALWVLARKHARIAVELGNIYEPNKPS